MKAGWRLSIRTMMRYDVEKVKEIEGRWIIEKENMQTGTIIDTNINGRRAAGVNIMDG